MHTVKTWVSGVVAFALATAMLGAISAEAQTTPVTGPAGTGTVTINNDHFNPGDTIVVSGTGLVTDPATAANPGNPVIAVKLNGTDYESLPTFPWVAGGPSSIDPSTLPTQGGSGAYAAFEVVNGSFSGTITIPANWTIGNQPRYYLTFLGGSLSTVSGGKVLSPMSANTDFVLLADDQQWASIGSVAHQQGSNRADNLQISVKLRNYQRGDAAGGQKVAFTIDASGPVLACIQTDSEGDADAVVPLPSAEDTALAAGDHLLNVIAGTACGEGAQLPARSDALTFKVATAEVTSTSHHPGGTATVALKGYLKNGVFGGQRVALQIGESGAVTCFSQLDNTGAGTATVPIPAGLAPGEHELFVLAGSACGQGAEPPSRSITLPLSVTAQPFAVSGVPAVSGVVRVGSRVSAALPNFTLAPSAVRYQWLRRGAVIAGATGSSYVPTAADRGAALSVRVTATRGSDTVVSTSAGRTVAAGVIGVTKRPAVKGTAKSGKMLTAVGVKFNVAGVKVRYQWLRNGKPIKGATKARYKVKKADRKKKISVQVTASKSGYTTTVARSAAKRIAK